MERFALLAVIVAAALRAAGAGAAGGPPLPIQQRLLPASDLKGFVAAAPYLTHSVTEAAGKFPLSAEQLRSYGFVALIRENLSGQGVNNAALSMAIQFKTATDAAKAAIGVKSFNESDGPWTYYRVPGIPGAYGFMSSGSGGSGYNVVFADGTFDYLVGIGSSATTTSTTTEESLITDAKMLYRRVHGPPAP